MKYFAYSPVDGIEFHDTKESAKQAAQEVLDDLVEAGFPGGDEPKHVCWGMILERGTAEGELEHTSAFLVT